MAAGFAGGFSIGSIIKPERGFLLVVIGALCYRQRVRSIFSLPSLATLLAAGALTGVLEKFLEISEQLSGMGLAGVALFALLYTAVSALGVPCLPFTLLGGTVFGPLWGTVAVMGGLTGGAAFGFLVARYAARDRLKRFLLKYRKLELVDHAVAHEGWRIVALLRLCPIPFGLSNYLYGLTGIDFKHYMLATLGAMLPGTAVFVYLGTIGRRGLEAAAGETPQGHPLQMVLGGVALLAAIAAFAIIGRIIKRVVEERIED